MTKVMKKLSCMLLAIAMVLTMMPALAFADDASSDVAFSVAVQHTKDGVRIMTGKNITRTWMESNKMEPQVFPFAGGQGKKWAYVVAEGPTYEDVMKEAFEVDDLDEIGDAKFYCPQGYYLTASEIKSGKYSKMFKCVDENGETVKGGFNKWHTENTPTIHTETILGSVTPIVALRAKEYSTIEEAQAAISSGDFAKEEGIDCCKTYVGGVDEEIVLWKNGAAANVGAINYNGKFALEFNTSDFPLTATLDDSPFDAPKKLNMAAVTVTKPTGSNAILPFDTEGMTDTEATVATAVTWTSTNESVATVDEKGHITPVKAGTCNVIATNAFNGYVCKAKVTVAKSAFAPLAVTNLKATNVKTRKAKLTWTKSAKANGYYVYRSTKKSSGFKKVKTLKKTASSYTSGKLTKNKTYYYKVVAYNSNGKTTAGPVKVKISK